MNVKLPERFFRALDWQVGGLHELSSLQVHDMLALRSAVFVVEQACVFQDIDGFDTKALHVLGYGIDASGNTQLQAYARCFAPGVKMPEASIGRVATPLSVRKSGLGHLLIQKTLKVVQENWGSVPIRIGAQMRLGNFYVQHGFVATGLPFMEDGIEHIEMLRQGA
jgi:ElaA protein